MGHESYERREEIHASSNRAEPLRVSGRLHDSRGRRHGKANDVLGGSAGARALRLVREPQQEHGSQWAALEATPAALAERLADRVQRRFRVTRPDRLWLADLS